MREFWVGIVIGSLIWTLVLGVVIINQRRQVRTIEAEAYAESYLVKKENLKLRQEIRWLYNSRK